MTDLNARAAREVMGWNNVAPLPGGNVLFGEPDDDYNRDYPSNPHKARVPNFTGLIQDAWMLVEELHKDDEKWWRFVGALLDMAKPGGTLLRAHAVMELLAEKGPEAITRAALAAVESN